MTPKTRQETFLHAMSQGAPTPEPITRTEQYYKAIAETMSDGTTKESLSVTENGNYIAPEGTLYTGVNVHLPLGTMSITENGTYNASSDGLEGYTSVAVDVPQTNVDVEALPITENGTYTADEGKAYSPVTVSVTPNLGTKSITTNGTYSAASDNKDGYSSVTVNVDDAVLFRKVASATVSSISASDFPSGMTHVRNGLFWGCSSLVTVDIPSTVTQIDSYAFYYTHITEFDFTNIERVNANSFCGTYLAAAVLPAITKIENGAFSLSKLESVEIGEDITEIDSDAFRNCTALADVIIRAETPPTLGFNVFGSTSENLVIRVPAASVDAYKAATSWSTYADRIQAITE